MATPVHAMLWELWRLSRREIVMRTLGPVLMWGGALFLLGLADGGLAATILTIPIFMLMALTSMFSCLWMDNFDNTGRGFAFYLGFTSPISTLKLVAIPMVYIAASAAVCYLVPAATVRMLFGLPLPLIPVAALVMAASAASVMAVWSPRSRLMRTINLFAVMIGFGALMWFGFAKVGLDPEAFLTPELLLDQFRFTAVQYTVLLMVFVACIAMTTVAVDRQRHGERLFDGWSSARRIQGTHRLLSRSGPFASSRHAQFWFEMRRSGMPLLLPGFAGALVAFLTMVVLNSTGALTGKSPLALWILVLLLTPAAYLLIGAEWLLGLRHKQGTVSLATFDATQPMGNGGLIGIKVLVLALGVGATWLAMLMTAGLWIWLYGDVDALRPLSIPMGFLGTVGALWWACAGLVVTVGFAVAGVMVIAGGLFAPLHPRLMIALVVSGGIYVLLALWDLRHGWVLLPFWHAHAWGISVVLPAATVLFWRRTLCQGYIQRPHCIALLGAWFVYIGAALGLNARFAPTVPNLPVAATAMALALLTVPLAAIAAATLALAAHRHR